MHHFIPLIRPLIVGIYCGVENPPLNEFLKQLVEELNALTTIGINLNGLFFKFTKVLFICDAPAHAWICGIKGHNAKHGCSWCRSIGKYDHNRVVHSTTIAEAQTDADYHLFQESNQVTISPLSTIHLLGFYSDFPVDYQHAVCLGVVRKLFNLYFGSKGKKKVSTDSVRQLSDKIVDIAKYTPCEFQRRPRRIDTELAHFKATEFRLFLLYLGPYLFKKVLPTSLYKHFLLLHFAIYTMSSQHYCKTYLNQAHRCIEIFVSEVAEHFHEKRLSYNMHIILHLAEFVNMYGNLNNFCTFEFENCLGALKRRVRKTRYIFKHVVNQAALLRDINTNNSVKELKFSDKFPNNCAIIDNDIILIDGFISDSEVSGSVLIFRAPLYMYPYDSTLYKIGFYQKSLVKKSGKPNQKCFVIPQNDEFVIIPFC
jgi:hypothetical protein